MAILRSGPVWALLVAQSGYIFCSWTLLSQIPSYINHVMQFNIKNVSVLESFTELTWRSVSTLCRTAFCALCRI